MEKTNTTSNLYYLPIEYWSGPMANGSYSRHPSFSAEENHRSRPVSTPNSCTTDGTRPYIAMPMVPLPN
jgi:hypothetical protein